MVDRAVRCALQMARSQQLVYYSVAQAARSFVRQVSCIFVMAGHTRNNSVSVYKSLTPRMEFLWWSRVLQKCISKSMGK